MPVDSNDKVRPGLGAALEDGDKLTFTKVAGRRRSASPRPSTSARVKKQRRRACTPTSPRPSAPAGPAAARCVYKVTLRERQGRQAQGAAQHRAARAGRRDRQGRHQGAPGARAGPGSNYASGSSVWDRIAACESGGNWAQHRQRLLRRPAVQPGHLAGVRRLRPPGPEQPRGADRRRRARPCRRGRLRRLAALCGAARLTQRRIGSPA